MSPPESLQSGAAHVLDALQQSGVAHVIGLPGTQTLPLDRVIAERESIRYVMARHETALPHIAWGYHEASGTVAATLTVPGPGETNAMHGLKNAHEDCVPIVHVGADVNPADRGKGPIHEIEPATYDNVLKANLQVERLERLRERVLEAVARARAAPMGPVRIGIPSSFLAADVRSPGATVDPSRTAVDIEPAIDRAVSRLAEAERPVLFVGGGCRRSEGAPTIVRQLAETLDAPVLPTYKGKGVIPDDDPRVLGVAAAHLNSGARRVLDLADLVLALGTNFDGLATADWTLPIGEELIHVDVDPDVFGRGYEAEIEIPADVAMVGRAILDGLGDAEAASWSGATIGAAVRQEYRDHLTSIGLLETGEPAKTPATLDALRAAIPSDAIVTTDIGGHRLWALQLFEATGPRRYITAGSWAGMGVGLPGAIGAALARDVPVVALHGDGGLMMCLQSLHTAAAADLDVTLVVFADDDYGIISKSPKLTAYTDERPFAWDRPNFVSIAEAFGCRGTLIRTPSGAADAVEQAIDRPGPDIVVVDIDPAQPSVIEAADYDSGVELD